MRRERIVSHSSYPTFIQPSLLLYTYKTVTYLLAPSGEFCLGLARPSLYYIHLIAIASDSHTHLLSSDWHFCNMLTRLLETLACDKKILGRFLGSLLSDLEVCACLASIFTDLLSHTFFSHRGCLALQGLFPIFVRVNSANSKCSLESRPICGVVDINGRLRFRLLVSNPFIPSPYRSLTRFAPQLPANTYW